MKKLILFSILLCFAFMNDSLSQRHPAQNVPVGGIINGSFTGFGSCCEITINTIDDITQDLNYPRIRVDFDWEFNGPGLLTWELVDDNGGVISIHTIDPYVDVPQCTNTSNSVTIINVDAMNCLSEYTLTARLINLNNIPGNEQVCSSDQMNFYFHCP